jgi:hypothetical protein
MKNSINEQSFQSTENKDVYWGKKSYLKRSDFKDDLVKFWERPFIKEEVVALKNEHFPPVEETKIWRPEE